MEIAELLQCAAQKRVLFLGETIEDIYHYGYILGRSSKEPMLTLQHERTEAFRGGVVAAAEHARTFCKQVDIYSTVTLQKHRYIDEAHTRKLFEVYTGNVVVAPAAFPDLSAYDVVVVTDYGHGMIDDEMACRLGKARFIAVNVQTNAGNFGYNLATKYSVGAKYLCIDELEARLATRNRSAPIEDSLSRLAVNADIVVVTLGKKGAIANRGSKITTCAAFTDRVVDTMGAGDAFLAVTSIIAAEAPLDMLLRIGNAAAAMKVQNIGHRNPVTKHGLIAYFQSQGR